MAAITVDVAGGPFGGAARFREELLSYLRRHQRSDVRIIGEDRRLNAAWLLRRELVSPRDRRIALNNVSFVIPGGERWTLLGNALHFLTDTELSELDPSLRSVAGSQATVVRAAARRSDVLIAPCSAMAERVAHVLPRVASRVVVRMHPVSPGPPPDHDREPFILCPVVFEPYKHMIPRITEWLDAVDGVIPPEIRLLITASTSEVSPAIVSNPRVQLLGRLSRPDLHKLWQRCAAIFFPSGLESFGYPLAEARAQGCPAIALDTAQNREIAGPALRGFTPGDGASLIRATEEALNSPPAPDPRPFDPDSYFDRLLEL